MEFTVEKWTVFTGMQKMAQGHNGRRQSAQDEITTEKKKTWENVKRRNGRWKWYIFMVKPRASGADDYGLKYTQEAGGADGETPHHLVQVKKNPLHLKSFWKYSNSDRPGDNNGTTVRRITVDEGQVINGQVCGLRPTLQKKCEDVEENEETEGQDSNATLKKKRHFSMKT